MTTADVRTRVIDSLRAGLNGVNIPHNREGDEALIARITDLIEARIAADRRAEVMFIGPQEIGSDCGLPRGTFVEVQLGRDGMRIAFKRNFREGDFQPVKIKGEPISETVIRDRR